MSSKYSRLAEALQEHGYDAFLAWSPITMGYLADLFENGHERFITFAVNSAGDHHLICPALTVNQAERMGIESLAGWRDGEDPIALFKELADRWDLSVGILAVDPEMPARHLLALQNLLPSALFKDGDAIISGLMRQKDATEIDAMTRAARIADDAWIAIQPYLTAGVTEASIAQKLSELMRAAGGKPTFTIIAAGPNGAEPHHNTDESVLKPGDVVILDFGCEVDHYQSDITRTICIGAPTDEAKTVYDIVYRAHLAGRDAIAVGKTGADADAAARKVIVDAGYGEFFNHRLGHGIGMNGHEAPNLAASNTEPLAIGDCFSIEPGIYLPGKFGVRIENIYTLTEDGAQSLNDLPSPILVGV